MDCLEQNPVSSVILAGGYGRRMGGEKLFLEVNSVPLVTKVIKRVLSFSGEIILSVAPRQAGYIDSILSGIISPYGIRIVEDEPGSDGPLAGMYSGLMQSSFDWSFICACDMPSVSDAVVRTLWRSGTPGTSVIVPKIGGYWEPLHAFYHKSCLPAMRKALEKGERKITSFFSDVTLSEADEQIFAHLPGFRKSFGNLNSRKDLSENSHLFE